MRTAMRVTGMWVVTVAASAVIGPTLPAKVPVHWGLDGQPDRWGSKWELLLLGPVVLAVVAGLSWFLDRRDTVKRPGDNEEPRRQVLALAMALLAFLHVMLLVHVGGAVRDLFAGLGAGLSVFWALMGNLMGRVRPNGTTGIRTPWTLRSPEIWRRTHRFAGHLMVLAGVLGALGSLLLPGVFLLPLVVGLILVSGLGPVLYSFLLSRGA